jgi:hypothetical protein
MTLVPSFEAPRKIEILLNDLITELQRENMRLQRLISELLLKNQQLRIDS